jgi:hypothetical protein
MAHDHNGRVGPPRCEECNAPLNSDDRRLLSTRWLCLDCHLECNPFPRIKKRRTRSDLRITAADRLTTEFNAVSLSS